MSSRLGNALPPEVATVLREFVNALGKCSMYPAGHAFVSEATERLTEVLANTLETRGGLVLGFTPRTVLLDGAAIEPIPSAIRQFGQRLHRRNIGTIQLSPGIATSEVAAMLAALSAPDADEVVGREGLKLAHVRIEPLVYDVLAFGEEGSSADELDEIFWSRLVEAAFGHRLGEGQAMPNAASLAEAINDRAASTPGGARRVFEALSSFASALHARGERAPGGARKRFVEVIAALSHATTTRVMEAAPSRPSRRRFMRETLEQVPPTLLLQLLESVAEADGEPISSHLRAMLGKLSGGDRVDRSQAQGDFATEVMGLLEQWDGEAPDSTVGDDPRLALEIFRVLALSLELAIVTPGVLAAARRSVAEGHIVEALELMDRPGNDPDVRRQLTDALLDPGLLDTLLDAAVPDWPLIERVAHHAGPGAAGPLLNAIDAADERATRRRLLDLLVSIGPAAEPELLDALDGATWHLARNILTVLAQLPAVQDVARVLPLLDDPEPRVRLEAMKVLLRQERTRDRAVSEALESGEPVMARLALASLDGTCPPSLVAAVLSALGIEDDDVRLNAIRLVGNSDSALVIPQLLDLVRERRGFFRRWRLREADPVMLEALAALARRWSNHRPVLMVLNMAAHSTNPDILDAIGMPQ
ncbi:MAG: HEAT repeat domain-containing protein [Gemmatimonadota bacterium]